ncbi:hypothetical protein BDA99DRAFT_562370 [Phascolomyces articulosus]|uniref:Uncharacterized protein n=1 Tax=Phascolomyces articulosus TaxID=60185 RepID=A0AAD5PB61_9FUNG|nr:hypothetical protein BDA99DRAFT_562370 [Phascolomyces articulosus]
MPFLKLTILNHDTPLFCGHGFQVERFSLCFIMVSLRGFSFIDEQGATFNGSTNLQQRPPGHPSYL